MKGIEIHGVWWFRRDTLEESVSRVAETFAQLAKLSPLWDPWFRTYRSFSDRARGAVKLTNEPELIREEFEWHKSEYKYSEDQGYCLRAFAGGPQKGKRMESSQFDVTCCHLPPYSGFNHFTIELPTMGPHADKLRNVEILANAVAVLVDIWDPDSVMVGDLLKKMVPWPNDPYLGWINYLSLRRACIKELPLGWRWLEGRKGRQIFIHEGGMPSPENPEHVAAFNRLIRHVRWETPPEGIVSEPNGKSNREEML